MGCPSGLSITLLSTICFVYAAALDPGGTKSRAKHTAAGEPLLALLGELLASSGGGGTWAGSTAQPSIPPTAVELLLQLMTGQRLYGRNCGPNQFNDRYVDDLDHCCFVHDKCHEQPEQQAQYKYCSLDHPTFDAFLQNFGVACECDAAFNKCVSAVRRQCDGLAVAGHERECRLVHAYKLSKAADMQMAFEFLDTCAQCPPASQARQTGSSSSDQSGSAEGTAEEVAAAGQASEAAASSHGGSRLDEL
ncbi:hypothetical protein D9Q98_009608 [Chlorella vulgaris]|uniref:Phospholipase A(2) n=1 Tax=Chlorella vulgaris TaxID=3077 RepID=A0A9D4YSN1_CHLVU|nr:hypothetical protein D9Q98_009608 [Chlorella vulgaris]